MAVWKHHVLSPDHDIYPLLPPLIRTTRRQCLDLLHKLWCADLPARPSAMDQTEALAEDTLADILGRLPPRDLAASRCVRKAWRATVDAHGLLLPHVLPRSVRGLFLNYSSHVRPRFFAGPSSTRQLPATIHGDLSFLPNYGGGSKPIMDHCNGLLLYRDLRTLLVVNPATRRWEDLTWEDAAGCDAYLAFDPAVSLHYEVFSVPHVPEKAVLNPSMPGDEGSEDGSFSEEEDDLWTTTESSGERDNNAHDLMECPPSLWTLNVFSSSTRQWEKRTFVRQAVAKGTVTHMLLDPTEPKPLSWGGPRCTCSAYWRGSLYVHFRGVFVVRSASLQNHPFLFSYTSSLYNKHVYIFFKLYMHE
uniref:Uncharacterized protein n=1 Tax=Avena sativa TaxID=4498 RepID=A0ACD5ZNX9_AVESA